MIPKESKWRLEFVLLPDRLLFSVSMLLALLLSLGLAEYFIRQENAL